MIQVMLSGCNGKMGGVVAGMLAARDDIKLIGGFDRAQGTAGFPVYETPEACPLTPDCVIDFSHPSALTGLLDFCRRTGAGVVLATTGYSEEQLQEIAAASKEIRIFKSANMSLGINVLAALVRQAARVLGDGYDIEIVEKHHNRKLDAPSGTALMLADAAAETRSEQPEYIYERHSRRQKRDKREIGISSVRGGTIVGEHEVIFAGTDEVLTLSHSAYSREIFASGAISAAKFLSSQVAPGLYNMDHLVSEVI